MSEEPTQKTHSRWHYHYTRRGPELLEFVDTFGPKVNDLWTIWIAFSPEVNDAINQAIQEKKERVAVKVCGFPGQIELDHYTTKDNEDYVDSNLAILTGDALMSGNQMENFTGSIEYVNYPWKNLKHQIVKDLPKDEIVPKGHGHEIILMKEITELAYLHKYAEMVGLGNIIDAIDYIKDAKEKHEKTKYDIPDEII